MNEETNNSKGPKIIARLLVCTAIALLLFIVVLIIIKSLDNAKSIRSVGNTESIIIEAKTEMNTPIIN